MMYLVWYLEALFMSSVFWTINKIKEWKTRRNKTKMR